MNNFTLDDEDQEIKVFLDSEEDEIKPEKKKLSFLDWLSKSREEAGQQSLKQGFSSLVGALGNIVNLTGVNQFEPESVQEQRKREFEILDMMQKGEIPSLSEIQDLMTTEPVLKQYEKIPTSQDIEEVISPFIGEAETLPGEVSGRFSRLFGGSLPFGGINPSSAMFGAAGGQAAKELGFGPTGQAIAEVGFSLGRDFYKQPLKAANQAQQAEIDALRKLGLTDQEITIALNANKKNASLLKRAEKTGKVEQAIESTGQRS